METVKKIFKPFEKVLTNDYSSHSDSIWTPDFYAYSDGQKHYTVGTTVGYSDEEIVPFEGNEWLCGNSGNPDNGVEMAEGDWLFVSQSKGTDMKYWQLARYNNVIYVSTYGYCFQDTEGNAWKYAVPFDRFDPRDKNGTNKEILEVIDKKIVRSVN